MEPQRNRTNSLRFGSSHQYYAFISYKREDEKWAQWLHHKLEQYRLPTTIGRDRPELPKRIKPVFRDTTDIKPGVLAEVLTENLKQSKYLIVICSPRSAQSQWVGKEISEFIAQGKSNNIILFIVEGSPYSSEPTSECFHPIIKEKLPEMLGVNVHEMSKGSAYLKRQRAFIQVVAKLLDVSFDTLWQRQKRRILRNILLSVFALVLLISTVGANAYYQKEINKPFATHIHLQEVSYHNENLPIRNGSILLCYGRDTLRSNPIQSLNTEIEFKDIPGTYRGKNAFVGFRMDGFYPVDTLLALEYELSVPIHRNQRYGLVKGQIINGDGIGIDDVNVSIGSQKALSDSIGHFSLSIPDSEQSVSKYAVIERKGYKTVNGNFTVGESWTILLQKQ